MAEVGGIWKVHALACSRQEDNFKRAADFFQRLLNFLLSSKYFRKVYTILKISATKNRLPKFFDSRQKIFIVQVRRIYTNYKPLDCLNSLSLGPMIFL